MKNVSLFLIFFLGISIIQVRSRDWYPYMDDAEEIVKGTQRIIKISPLAPPISNFEKFLTHFLNTCLWEKNIDSLIYTSSPLLHNSFTEISASAGTGIQVYIVNFIIAMDMDM
jgi:hypothetical protein